MWSVTETFDRVRKHLPGCLPPDAVERCARIIERVPDETRSHYLEFRLNSGPEIDFLTLSSDKAIARRLSDQMGAQPSESWRHNLAVLQEWATDDSPLATAPFVCFEYDAGKHVEGDEPEASLVVGLEADYPRQRHVDGFRKRTSEEVALGKVAFRRLLPEAEAEACMAVLDRIYAALPPLGAIPHAPVMAARQPVTAKPYIILPRASLHRFLDDIGWPGSRVDLEHLLETYYSPFQETVYLDITVTDRVTERLGLATSQFQRREADFSSLDWWKLPEELAYFKAELQGWCGYTEEVIGGQRAWLRRWLDTKAVLVDGKVEYKAYLGFSPTRPPLFC